LRVYGCHSDDPRHTIGSVKKVLEDESENSLQSLDVFAEFQRAAEKIKDDRLAFLIEQKRLGKQVIAYGAAAKGNTLLNFAGLRPDLLPVVIDAARSKQGKFLPGSHLPIYAIDDLDVSTCDIILILPWNISSEVTYQIRKRYPLKGFLFIIAIPTLKKLEASH
jgi:hypothetical protein